MIGAARQRGSVCGRRNLRPGLLAFSHCSCRPAGLALCAVNKHRFARSASVLHVQPASLGLMSSQYRRCGGLAAGIRAVRGHGGMLRNRPCPCFGPTDVHRSQVRKHDGTDCNKILRGMTRLGGLEKRLDRLSAPLQNTVDCQSRKVLALARVLAADRSWEFLVAGASRTRALNCRTASLDHIWRPKV